MDPNVLNNQGLSFKIKDWTLDAYRRVLENAMIWRGFLNSFLYSLAFTVISVFVTLLAAYPLSKKELNKIAARWPAKAVAQFSTPK